MPLNCDMCGAAMSASGAMPVLYLSTAAETTERLSGKKLNRVCYSCWLVTLQGATEEELIDLLYDSVERERDLMDEKEELENTVDEMKKEWKEPKEHDKELERVEEETYEKAYDEGYAKGVKDGKEEAYSDAYDDGFSDGAESLKQESEAMVNGT